VARNRALLSDRLALPDEPLWLCQVHGCEVALGGVDTSGCEADAAVATGPGVVCAVLTADCLPLLLCDQAGTRVAAVHAGWRGLVAGVIETAVASMQTAPGDLLAWLGPAIGPDAFEVGDEVRTAFLARDPAADTAFRASSGGRWLADIYLLARRRLDAVGVGQVSGGGLCTVTDARRFYSYRRDGATGRMATLIWMTE
jgi:polyphenol oxidase